MKEFPILFLDIDGVLNHIDNWHGEKCNLIDLLDPVCVSRLNTVVSETECEVVVSSSWRIIYTLIEMQAMLNNAGYKHRLLSTTPATLTTRGKSTTRGNDIHRWISFHGRLNFGPIAIIDDDADMYPFMDRLVKTDFHNGGLKDEHVDQLIKLLKE